MKVLHKINDIVFVVEKLLLTFAVMGILITLLVNVFARFFLNGGVAWAEEVGNLLITILCFTGITFSARTGRHIIMSALYDITPAKVQKVITCVVDFCAIFFLIFIGYLGSSYVNLIFNTGRVTPSLLIPLWIPYLIIPAGCFFGAFQYFILFVLNVQDKTQIVKANERYDVSEPGDPEELTIEEEGTEA